MIPRCFKGETVVIIASGASLTQADIDYCQGKAKVVVINDNHRLAPWADLLYAADPQWWDRYGGVPEFKGQKWTQDKEAAERYGLHHVAGYWNPGISTDPHHIHYGWNSGFQAANLVFLMGAARILLLGFDMKMTAGKRHWFGNHPGELNRDIDFNKWAHHMDKAAKRYAKHGCEVINCSRETALVEYKKALINDCL